MADDQKWEPCPQPEIGDIIKWQEPLWAMPTKARGKPNKIGEQRVVAKLLKEDEIFILEVISVEKITKPAAPIKVKAGETIRRKKTSIAMGNCMKQVI